MKQSSKLFKIVGLLLVVGLLFAAIPAGQVQAATTVVYPSTNDLNRTKGWAHVNFVSADAVARTMTFNFVQPRAFYACVEYRTNLQTTPTDSRPNWNTLILDGMWTYTCRNTVGTTPITISLGAATYVEFRHAFGGESDERFYWTPFTFVPEVWVDDGYTLATPGWGVDHFLTIPEGINAVNAGGIVHVESGIYTGALTINKPLTLVSTSGASTTIINGGATLANPSAGLYVVDINASNVIMDGFTVTNPLFNSTWESDPIGITVGHYNNNTLENIRVTNNVVTKTTDPNWVVNYNAPHGIVINGVGAGFEIDHNVVHDLASVVPSSSFGGTSGIGFYGYGTTPLSTSVTIHDNEVYDIRVVNTGTGVAVPRGIRVGYGSGDATVSNNNIHDLAGIGIQVPSNNYGIVTITNNSVTKTNTGVFMGNANGGTIKGNNLFGNKTGIQIGGAANVGIHFNRIVGNVNGGLINTSTAIVAAENNWWGCNAGPNDATAKCDITANTGTGTITSSPWLILQTLANPTSVDPSGTAAITANLRTNSANVDTSANGYLVNGLPVAFTTTSIGGFVVPTAASTLDGQATTTFTATVVRGTYDVCSIVDNQTTCAPMTVSNRAPNAVDDFYETDQDKTFTIVAPGVLTNDTDPDGDIKAATLVTNVSEGTLSLLVDGSFTYTPGPGFFGTDTFTYQLVTYPALAVASGWTDEAVVTITVHAATPPEGPPKTFYLYMPLLNK